MCAEQAMNSMPWELRQLVGGVHAVLRAPCQEQYFSDLVLSSEESYEVSNTVLSKLRMQMSNIMLWGEVGTPGGFTGSWPNQVQTPLSYLNSVYTPSLASG